jgi:thioredoxin 2
VGEPLFEKMRQRSELPLLVDFWAEWCGPCKMMAPQLKKAASLLEPSVQIVKVNTETCPQLASAFQIRSIPTLVLMRAGREIGRQSGAIGSDDIVRWTRGTLQKP